MTGAWQRQESRISYRTGNGAVIDLTAREIWGAEFAGLRNFGGEVIASAPSADLPDISFSRFPAQPAIRVSGSTMSGLRTELVAQTEAPADPIRLESRTQDQLIEKNIWFPVDCGEIEIALQTLDSAGIAIGATITLGQLIRLRSLPGLGLPLLDEAETDPVAALKCAAAIEPAIPGLSARLYNYQSAGIAFLRQISDEGLGCILGDEMGLGKTLQVIALLQSEKNAGRGPCLVISPATLLENWRRELLLFAPGLTVNIHAGSGRAGIRDRLVQFDVVVTSYDTALRDEPLLASIAWNVMALDEAQNIKNPDAARTRCVNTLDRRVSVAVTGTPVENRLSDLWSIANFALPMLLGSLKDFESQFENSPGDASRLAPLVAPILLRRRVSEVAKDLPPRIDIPQPVAMTRNMADEYERIREQAIAEYGPTGSLVALQRLRMFCAHTRLVGLDLSSPLTDTPKYRRAVELLEEIFDTGEKALLFSTYTGMADLFLGDLPARFPGVYFNCIDGRVAVPDRQPIVDEFSGHSGPGALILNPKAAGVGLNITAANHVIHYNPEWNPALEDQASARAYRRKQTRPVTVHHLYFSDCIEETMIERLNFKRTVADGAVSGHKGDATPADVIRALSISPLSKLGLLE